MGGVEDRLGGAVVLLQVDGLRVRVVALEVQDVADIGRAPGVDRLIGVAHNADVAVAAGQQPRELVLRHVGVLELVDQHVEEALLVLLAGCLVLAQQLHRAQDHVVEVEGVVRLQRGLVAVVRARDDLAEVVAHAGGVGAGRRQLALGAGDGGQHGPWRELLRVHR